MTNFVDINAIMSNNFLIDYLGLRELKSLRQANRQLRHQCDSKSVWSAKLRMHFPQAWEEAVKSKCNNFRSVFIKHFNLEYAGLSLRQKMLFSYVKEGDAKSLQDLSLDYDEWLLTDNNNVMLATWASQTGNQSLIDLYFKQLDQNRQQGLFWPMLFNQIGEVKARLNAGADTLLPAVANQERQHALFFAVKLNNSQLISFLLKDDDDVEIIHNGRTLLILAAELGHLETVECLLELGAQLESADNANGKTALMYAAENGRVKVIKKLLEFGAQIDTVNPQNGQTAFAYATGNNHVEAMGCLATLGANINAINNNGWSALHVAARKGDGRLVRALLELGASVDLTTPAVVPNLAWTPLIAAAHAGHVNVIRCLAEFGANLDLTSSDHATALKWAAAKNHVEVIKCLVALGADIEVSDAGGCTPLLCAAKNGCVDAVRCLVSLGANVQARCNTQYNAFTLACYYKHAAAARYLMERLEAPIVQAVRFGTLEVVRYALELGADIEARDQSGYTALHWSSSFGNEDKVRCLVELGANINARAGESGRSVLTDAVIRGDINMVNTLLQLGANLHLREAPLGWTAFMWAAFKGHKEIIEVLVNLGADVELRSHDGATPIWWAAKNGHLDLVRSLASLGANVNVCLESGRSALMNSALQGDVDMIKCLVELGANIEARDLNGKTALDYAVENGRIEVVKCFIELGFEVGAYHQSSRLDIYKAVNSGDVNKLACLLELGVNFNGHDSFEKVIFTAAEKGNAEMIKMLAAAGCNIERGYFLSPLMIAAENGHLEAVKTLVELKADLEKRSSLSNQTAFEIAWEMGREAIVDYIPKANQDIYDNDYCSKLDLLRELEGYIEQLNLKAHICQGADDSSRADSISSTLRELSHQLTCAASQYKRDTSPESHKVFKASCEQYILEASRKLTHRNIKYILANIPLMLLGLGVGYVLAGCIHKAATGRFLFFSKTDTAKKLGRISKCVAEAENIIPSSIIAA